MALGWSMKAWEVETTSKVTSDVFMLGIGSSLEDEWVRSRPHDKRRKRKLYRVLTEMRREMAQTNPKR